MMDMLLMSPMREQLPTQRLQLQDTRLLQLMLLQLLPMLLQLLPMLSMLPQLLPMLLQLLPMLHLLLPMESMLQLPTPQSLPLLPQSTMEPTSPSMDMAMDRSATSQSASHSRENTEPPLRARLSVPTPLLLLMPPTDFTEPRESLLTLSMPQSLPMLLPQLLLQLLVKPKII